MSTASGSVVTNNVSPSISTAFKQTDPAKYISLGDFIDLLVAGCAVAALVQALLPRQWLLAVGGAPTLSILALMALSLVLSVCSSVDAFLALGFAAQITPGALLAFLLLGTVIDIKLVGLLGLLFKPRGLLLTAAGSMLVVLLIGQWVNLWRL